MVVFVYIWSLSLWFVDATIFAEDPLLAARGLGGEPLNTGALLEGDIPERMKNIGSDTANVVNNGSIIDRIGQTAAGGVVSTWTIIELMTGTYAFDTLRLIGLPGEFVVILQLIFPVIVAVTIVFYITGRQ